MLMRWVAGAAVIALVSFGVITFCVLSLPAAAEEKTPARTDLAGDSLPEGAIARLGTQHWRHGAKVAYVAFINDGKEVLTSCNDGILHVWDAKSGKEIRQFGEPVTKVEATPRRRTLPPTAQLPLCLARDQKAVFIAPGDGKIHVWDVATGKEQHSFEPDQTVISALAITANGKQLFAIGSSAEVPAPRREQKVEVWDPAKGEFKSDFAIDLLGFLSPNLADVVFSPDGRSVAYATSSASGPLGTKRTDELLIVHTKDGKERHRIKNESTVRVSLRPPVPAFTADGKTLAWSWADGTIHLFDTASGKEGDTLGKSKDRFAADADPTDLHFSPDGKMLAGFARDGNVVLFDVASKEQLTDVGDKPSGAAPGNAFATNYATLPLAWSPDGKTIATAEDSVLRVWDVHNGKGNDLSGGHVGNVVGVQVADAGKSATTLGRDNTLRAWDVGTGKEKHKQQLPEGTYNALLISPTQTLLFNREKPIRIWDLKREQEVLSIDDGPGDGTRTLDNYTHVAVGGDTLALVNQNQFIRAFRLNDGSELRPINDLASLTSTARENKRVVQISCSHDGNLLAIVVEKSDQIRGGPKAREPAPKTFLRLYQLSGANLVWETELKLTDCRALSFSPNGRNVAVASGTADSFMLLEAATGKPRLVVKKHADALAFSDDGAFVALGTSDSNVCVLDARNGKEILAGEAKQGSINLLTFGPKAETVFSGGADGSVLVWDTRDTTAQALVTKERDPDAAARLWADLSSADNKEAYAAVTALFTSPKAAVTVLRDKLQPAKGVDDALIDNLIAQLKSDDSATRDKARTQLGLIGERAHEALKGVLNEAPNAELHKQIEQLLAWLDPATPMPEVHGQFLAIEVLETIATPEARTLLASLAKGARGARLTHEAAAALRRLPKD